ncbi:hypothetical protein IDF54_14630, partial [Flavobacterium sp. SaA2.13]|nr:hypothetical protein [Flavobacterium sp. SaA2.13]
TTAVVTAISLIKQNFPNNRPKEINGVIERAVKYDIKAQRPDGSWYGSWGVCFTYASFFAMQCLELVDQTWQNSSHVRK